MSVQALLDRLEGVKRTGPGRWVARCPVHSDRRPSLSVRELDDGRVLLHDFAGCSAEEILAAAGLQFEDLFPERRSDERPPRIKKPWRAQDLVAAMRFEIDVGMVILSAVARGEPISDADRKRAGECAQRFARFAAELEHAA
jgi:hypothetical protein